MVCHMTDSPRRSPDRRRLAPAPPLPESRAGDGVALVASGTVLFALASVLLAIGYPRLVEAGRGWWLGVAVSGTGLGLAGLLYCLRRRRSRRIARLEPPASLEQ